MKKLTQGEVSKYLYQSYSKVDGLWFMKVEEQFGFEKALEIDADVWKILSKIQARYLKLKLSNAGITAKEVFISALKIKLDLDGYKFRLINKDNLISIKITECPWHNILIRSGREDLSEKIGSIICKTEYSAFAYEFDPKYKLEICSRICSSKKENFCIFNFDDPI